MSAVSVPCDKATENQKNTHIDRKMEKEGNGSENEDGKVEICNATHVSLVGSCGFWYFENLRGVHG